MAAKKNWTEFADAMGWSHGGLTLTTRLNSCPLTKANNVRLHGSSPWHLQLTHCRQPVLATNMMLHGTSPWYRQRLRSRFRTSDKTEHVLMIVPAVRAKEDLVQPAHLRRLRANPIGRR